MFFGVVHKVHIKKVFHAPFVTFCDISKTRGDSVLIVCEPVGL